MSDADADSVTETSPHPTEATESPGTPGVKRYRMTIAYDGAAFHGWQRQPELRTVQQVIEEAMRVRLGQPLHVQGASRTDSGVHALGQVAHFDAATRIPTERLAPAITSRLPRDVEVRNVVEAPSEFDAIRGAVDKQYRYRIWMSPHRPLHQRDQVYPCRYRLDLNAMHDAAARLVGEHDFAAFATAGHGRATTVRTVFACYFETAGTPDAPEVHLVIRGNGFLWNMVRIIAGTLVEIGRGSRQPDLIETLYETGDRSLAGKTLPAAGLYLEWIRYADDPVPDAD